MKYMIMILLLFVPLIPVYAFDSSGGHSFTAAEKLDIMASFYEGFTFPPNSGTFTSDSSQYFDWSSSIPNIPSQPYWHNPGPWAPPVSIQGPPIEQAVATWSMLTGWSSMSDGIVPQLGDPLGFSFTNNTTTVTVEPDWHNTRKQKLDLLGIGHDVHLARQLGDETFTIVHKDDYLWSASHNAYEIFEMMDTDRDGQLDESDPVWKDLRMMDTNLTLYPMTLIKSIDYTKQVCFEDDEYGVGVYADWVGVSENHFRILCHNELGMTLYDGTIIETFALVQGGLQDCGVNDIRYALAEGYQRNGDLDKAMRIYINGFESCNNSFYDYHSEYLTHWISGVGSVYHRANVLYGADTIENAKYFYELSLSIKEHDKTREDLQLLKQP